MSSTIVHESDAPNVETTPALTESPHAVRKHPFLVALGERVKGLRARRGMTRKALSLAAEVSERHLANLEYGEGNASILVLLQVASALQCSLAEIIGDPTTTSTEWLLLRELLENRDEATLRRVRVTVGEMLGTGGGNAAELRLFSGRRSEVPSVFISGAADWGIHQMPGALRRMREEACARMLGCHLIQGAGHWVQQEQPASVTRHIVDLCRARP